MVFQFRLIFSCAPFKIDPMGWEGPIKNRGENCDAETHFSG